MDEIRYIACTLVGAGVERASLEEALKEHPHFIACDAGTTDAGPFSLGSGQPAFPREAVKRDLTTLLEAGRRAGIPVLIGSAGTAGGDAQVDWPLDIVNEIMREAGVTLRVAVIYAEQDKDALVELFRQERIKPLDAAPHLDEDTIKRSAHIIGMMGAEPLEQALAEGVDFILAGRCSDSALYAAMPLLKGFPAGLAWHAGKVVECGTMACETVGKGVMFVRLQHDHFLVKPFGQGLRCTPQSVAAHSLYENVDPFHFTEASGTADITEATYEAIDPITVRVANSRFQPADTYTIKLEGAELVGYQTVIIGGIRVVGLIHGFLVDPVLRQAPVLLVWYIAVATIGTAAYLYQELLHPFIRRLWQYNYAVEAINRLNQKTVEVVLTPVAQPVSFVAGQFLFVRFGGGLGWERHPFTVSSAPQEASLRLSIKGLGDDTQRMIEMLQPGISARVGRAFGMFDYRRGSSQQVWIAGGIGITPFRSWIHAFPTEQPLEFDIDLYYTVHNEDEVLFLDEIRTAEAHYPTFRPHITYSKREGPLTMEHIASRSRGLLSEKEVYMCGPDKMIQHFQRAFRRRGVPSHHIHYEYFNFR